MLDVERRQTLRRSGEYVFGVLADVDAIMVNLTGQRVRPGDADRRQDLVRGGETIFAVLADHDAIVGHMSDGLAGYPTGHIGSGEGDGLVTDDARQALIEFNKDIRTLRDVTSKLEGTRMRWGRGEYIPERMLRDPGCEVIDGFVKRNPSDAAARSIPPFEPTHRFGNVGGRLPKSLRLGLWSYEFVARYGDPKSPSASYLPTDDEVRAHLQGRRVRRRAPEPSPRTPTIEGESWVEHGRGRAS